MGGKEGSRGYLYQAIAAVLNSLKEKEWKYVQVEPDSQNDKIDVLWEYENGMRKATQVKSSINNISKANIINWLEELIEDAIDIEEVSLLLIGSCNDSTKKFINRLIKRDNAPLNTRVEQSELSETLNSYSGKIHIQFENFNQESLESMASVALERFLDENGHSVNYQLRQLIMRGAFYQFFGLSKDGRKLSREEFEQQILDWVYFNYPEVKGEGSVRKNLVVQFYKSRSLDFSTKMEQIPFLFNTNPLIDSAKEQVLNIISEIEGISLLPKKEGNTTNEILDGNMQKSSVSDFLFSKSKYSEIPDKQKETIINSTYRLVGKHLSKSFFFVGELKVVEPSGASRLLEGGRTTLEGEQIEKEKLIREFVKRLDYLEAAVNYFEYLGKYSIVPLVLSNKGQIFNEDIKVTLKFPKTVNVATENSFEAPNSIDLIEEFTQSNGFFDQLLRHQTDSKVNENVSLSHSLWMPPSFSFESYMSNVKTLEDSKSDFRSFMSSFLNAEAFYEQDYTVLKYDFNKLNVSENISFPSYILVNADSSFEIDYEITSKNLNRKIKGKLFYGI